jgi:diadenosine tetraphosphate (Ap4A) HIT family hydrolase
MSNCIFCKINNKGDPLKIISENDDILAFAPRKQVPTEHTFVAIKNHFKNIFDINKNTLEKLITVSKDLEVKILIL